MPPSSTSGRRRSVLLLLLSVVLALILQYAVAPYLITSEHPIAQFFYDGWSSGCESYATNNGDFSTTLLEACAGQSGVFRAAGTAVLFFLFAGIAAYLKPTANRDIWPTKYALYTLLVFGSLFLSNEPLFSPILLNVFRVGAVFFILFQQLVILDLAYNFNESWVENSNVAEEQEVGSGNKWLIALVSASVILGLGSLTVIGGMYHVFRGCDITLAFITVTLVLGVLCVIVQLKGEESSVFTSMAIFSYGTYLCFTAISKNPNEVCNPRMGKRDVLGIVLGISFTLLSMAWAGYSYTAHKPVNASADYNVEVEKEVPNNPESTENRKVGGVVLTQGDEYGSLEGPITDEELPSNKTHATEEDPTKQTVEDGHTFSNSWKLNVILALLTCWYAMSLTGWGAIEVRGGNLANPDAGRVSMWMIITSQWIMFLLYLWTLVAPSLFPNREFS